MRGHVLFVILERVVAEYVGVLFRDDGIGERHGEDNDVLRSAESLVGLGSWCSGGADVSPVARVLQRGLDEV